MAITATVAAVAGTVYVADKMGDAADAQRAAAETASANAQREADAISQQTAALQAELEATRQAMADQATNNQSLLTQQQDQFNQLISGQQASFETQLAQTQGNYESLLAGQQSQMEQTLAAQQAAMAQQQTQFERSMAQTQAQYEQSIAQQREAAAANAQLAEEAKNRANQKKPASEAFIAANERKGLEGFGGTLLTGTGGISSAAMPLGKSTLLGA